MSKITSSLPAHKKIRKEKILKKQGKIDKKNSKQKVADGMRAEDERNAARKGKVAAKTAAAKERKKAASEKTEPKK